MRRTRARSPTRYGWWLLALLLGSSLVVAMSSSGMLTPPSWPPGPNGLYGRNGATLEIRDGEPLLHVQAGQSAG
jgi:hypothetical protein